MFGRHRPLLSSILQRSTGFSALCNDCGLPIERGEEGRWTQSESLIAKRDRAA